MQMIGQIVLIKVIRRSFVIVYDELSKLLKIGIY